MVLSSCHIASKPRFFRQNVCMKLGNKLAKKKRPVHLQKMVAKKVPVYHFPSRDLKKKYIRGDKNLLLVDGPTNSKLFAGDYEVSVPIACTARRHNSKTDGIKHSNRGTERSRKHQAFL